MSEKKINPMRIEIMEPEQVRIMRGKTSRERMQMLADMCEFARGMMRAVVRREHTDWTDEQVEAEVARRWCDDTGSVLPIRRRSA